MTTAPRQSAPPFDPKAGTGARSGSPRPRLRPNRLLWRLTDAGMRSSSGNSRKTTEALSGQRSGRPAVCGATRKTSPFPEIRPSTRTIDGAWSDPETVAGPVGNPDAPAVALDDHGGAVAVWRWWNGAYRVVQAAGKPDRKSTRL